MLTLSSNNNIIDSVDRVARQMVHDALHLANAAACGLQQKGLVSFPRPSLLFTIEFQEKNFQVKSNKCLELPRNFAFMTISASHHLILAVLVMGPSLSRFPWPCCDKLRVAARANWNAI